MYLRVGPSFMPTLLPFAQTVYLADSLETSVFHAHKSNDPFDRNNCLPVSLTPAISEVFDTVTSDQLRSFLEPEELISDRQHGFLSCHSMGNLMTLV